MFMIQLAKRAGYKVIATSSPSSFNLVKSYGADQVVSYRDHQAALAEIKQLTGQGEGIVAGLDCVGGQKNIDFAIKAFGPSGGKLTSLLPGSKSKRRDVKLTDILLYTVFGKVGSFHSGTGTAGQKR
jgi:NADPH:quinone reductase-like Zn-dependent oxidoreductase